jgi:hypothetical protein
VSFNILERSGFGLKIRHQDGEVECQLNSAPSHLKQWSKLVWIGPRQPLLETVNGVSCYVEKLHFECTSRSPNPVSKIHQTTMWKSLVWR